MKKIINHVDNVVTELLAGVAIAHPELQVNLDPMYIIRREKEGHKVALISGGGSGHEPMHGGFVGAGMLDGACPGQMFTSPTPDQMLECAQKAESGEGVLFLIKNYTGDILNFEIAAELLHEEGIPVQVAIIDDDVAVKDSLHTAGRRGVAATVLAEKILGAATQEGYSLEKISELAINISNRARSIGIALSACTVPAAGKPSFVLPDDEIEFGVGIHGEPGIGLRKLTSADNMTSDMIDELLNNAPYQRIVHQWDNIEGKWEDQTLTTESINAGDKVIVLVNNLGSTPQSELYLVYRKVAELLEKKGITIEHNLIGTYCTALDMRGISITLLKVDDEMLSLYNKPVNTAALRWGC